MPTCLLTFDLEDWYQLLGERLFGRARPRPDRLAAQLDRLLTLLARHRAQATFFCLGKSLEQQAHLVRRIADAGHEVASHGWGHEPIYRIGLRAFRDDLHRSLGWLQDLLGCPVLGYRAPAFSVAPEQLVEFYDICLAEGLRYDSSVVPAKMRRYGIPGGPVAPVVVRKSGGRKLVEIPLSTVWWLGRRWPVAGGGYWRVLPRWAIRAAVRRVHQDGLPLVTYFHPYEFDAQRLSGPGAAGWSLRAVRADLAQNLRRGSMHAKLDWLLSHHRCQPVAEFLNALESAASVSTK